MTHIPLPKNFAVITSPSGRASSRKTSPCRTLMAQDDQRSNEPRQREGPRLDHAAEVHAVEEPVHEAQGRTGRKRPDESAEG